MDTYKDFLRNKNKKLPDFGFDIDLNSLNPALFDWQKYIVKWAIKKGRCALFEDCGLGKTIQSLEWVTKIIENPGSHGLIIAPLAVNRQTKKIGDEFGYEVNICRSEDDIKNGINICNYEIMHKFDFKTKEFIVLDESSIIKNEASVYLSFLLDNISNIKYRLCCTATPSPNDYTELGNHAEILGVCTRGEMLGNYFYHDSGNTSKWTLMEWSKKDFWDWLADWSVMIKKPSDIGFSDDNFKLPKLIYHEHIIKTDIRDYELFREEVKSLSDRRDERNKTLEKRTDCAKSLIKEDEKWVFWCNFNPESEMLSKKIDGSIELKGPQKAEYKANVMNDFANGKIDVLITKPRISGFGMNFQICNNTCFTIPSDSYEEWYQSIRRFWRFGAKEDVNVHMIITDRENPIIENLKEKMRKNEEMAIEMVKAMSEKTKIELGISGKIIVSDYKEKIVKGENWTAYYGDCVEISSKQPDNKYDFCIYSPPFAEIYRYSDSERDMGNSKSYHEFFEHYNFLVKEQFRTLKPGRLAAIHCMNIPAMKERDGYIGIKNFRDDIIRIHQKNGFIYHSEIVIPKDPLIESQRTRAKGLAHKNVIKDSACLRQALPDYLCVFYKPGKNEIPISHPDGFTKYIGIECENPGGKYDEEHSKNRKSQYLFRRYAESVWWDIRQTKTLKCKNAKDDKDVKHPCPLQLDVIERAIYLWSNKDDLIVSWFGGIGSEGYVAISNDRRCEIVELKESYYNELIKNLERAEKAHKQLELPM